MAFSNLIASRRSPNSAVERGAHRHAAVTGTRFISSVGVLRALLRGHPQTPNCPQAPECASGCPQASPLGYGTAVVSPKDAQATHVYTQLEKLTHVCTPEPHTTPGSELATPASFLTPGPPPIPNTFRHKWRPAFPRCCAHGCSRPPSSSLVS